MNDKISIIIPCYNAEKYIDRCLESLETQTYGISSLEIILINDASTDNTYEHLVRFEEKYPENVMVINCEENSGPATIRNIGLKYATGAYISFVDADDAVDALMFKRMYEAMKRYDVDVVECSYKSFCDVSELFVQKNDSDYLLNIKTSQERGRFILNSFKTAVWGRLYKKSFLDDNALCFPENMIYGEDNFFSGLSMLMCKSYYHIGDTLYYYFKNADGIIQKNNDNGRIRQLMDIMRLYINELDARGFLDGPISGYGMEFEWYMIYKYFMDPVSFVISRKLPDWREQVGFFASELLRYFPEAYNNAYLNNNERWKDYIDLLREADKHY